MMGVIFGLQFVDRSFGPVLPLYVEQVGVVARARADCRRRALLDHGVHRRARSSLLRHGCCSGYHEPRRDRRRRGGGGRRARRSFGAAGQRRG